MFLRQFIRFSFASKKHMFIFGPPGVGKGSYAARLKDDLNLNHISTGNYFLFVGDEIRAILKNPEKTKYSKELVEEIRAIVTAGDLISDQIVMEILKEKIISSDKGVLLDGVPRTLTQLQLYDKLGFPIDIVLNIDLDREYLIRRLLARRVCKKCGSTYNLMSLPPKKSGVCDKDGVELIKRADDQEEVIRNRMQEYAKLTQPLLDVFESRGLTFDYDAIDGFKTYDKLLKDLKGKLNV